jgi:hypothetical protein
LAAAGGGQREEEEEENAGDWEERKPGDPRVVDVALGEGDGADILDEAKIVWLHTMYLTVLYFPILYSIKFAINLNSCLLSPSRALVAPSRVIMLLLYG